MGSRLHLLDSGCHLQDHSKLCTFLGLLKLLLSLAELGKVESGFRLSRSKFSLQLLDFSFKLGHGSLSSFKSSVLCISKTTFKLSKLIVQRVLGTSQVGSMILLCPKFVSKTSSINHGLLCFLLSILCCYKHTINLSLHGMDGRFQLALGSHITSVDSLHVVDSTTSISDVSLQLTLGTARSIQKGFAFFNFSRERAAALRSEMPTCSVICAFARASSSKSWMVSRSWV